MVVDILDFLFLGVKTEHVHYCTPTGTSISLFMLSYGNPGKFTVLIES